MAMGRIIRSRGAVWAGACLTLLLVAWAMSSQPFSAPDEGPHYLRALTIANGHLLGRKVTYANPAETPAQVAFAAHDTRAVWVPAAKSPPGFYCLGGTRDVRGCMEATPTGDYYPLPYLLPAVAVGLAHNASTALWLARLGSALLCAAMLVLAFALLWDGGGWSLVGLLGSLTPMVLFVASIVNPSGLEIAASLAFAAANLRVARSAPRTSARVWLALAVSGAMLLLSFQASPVYAVFDILLGAAFIGSRPLAALVSARKRQLALVSGALLAALIVWVIYSKASGISHATFGVSPLLPSLKAAASQMQTVLEQAVGDFGSLSVPLSGEAYALWLLFVAGLVVGALVVGTTRERVVTVLAVIAALAFPVLANAWIYRHSGFAMQARQVLPALFLAPLAAGEVLYRHSRRLNSGFLRFAPAGAAGFVLLFQLYAWFVNEHESPGGGVHVRWSPPPGRGFWIVIAVLSTLGLAAWAGRRLWALRTEDPDPASARPEAARVADSRLSAGRITRAGIGQSAATLWSAALGLLTTPFLIAHLGTSRYGMFALIAVASSYLSNLEFGFGHACIRFLARAQASGDVDEQRAVFGNGLTVFVVGAVVACGLMTFGASFIVRHFAHGPLGLHGTFVDAVRLAGPIIAASMLNSFASACLLALGKFRYVITISWIIGTLLSVTAVSIVALGGGLVTVIAAQLIINSLLLLIYSGVLMRESSFTLRPSLDRHTFLAMGKFSVWIMLAGIATQTMIQGPPAVLAGYRTTAELAAFAVPNTIFQQLTGLVGATGIGFLPYVSAASIETDLAPLRAIYAANLRITILALAPVVSFLAVFAYPLLAFWINPRFAHEAATPLRLLMGASLALGISAAPSDLARGFGRPRLVTAYAAITAAVVLGLSFATVPSHGPAGAAFGLSAGLAVVTIPFAFFSAHVITGLRPASLLRSLSGPAFGLAVVAGLYECGLLVSDTFIGAVVSGAIGTAVYAVLATKFFLDDRERAVFRSILPTRRRPQATQVEGA